MTDAPVIGLITAPENVADKLAKALVEAELAACVNVIGGVKSTYRWQGAVETDDESLLIIKTTRPSVAKISALLDEIHPNDVFELVVVDIVDGNSKYLDWLAGAVRQ